MKPLPILLLATLLLTTCLPERDNPWDNKAGIDPKTWAPTNLAAEDVSITAKKLTWKYSGDARIEGFTIDRKQGNANWQTGYMVMPKEAREAIDAEVTPDTTLTYTYRVYAIAGQNSSTSVTLETKPVFPAPTTITAQIQSPTHVTISWQYTATGHQGFTIARQVNDGEWQTNFATTASNKLEFTDSTVNFSANHYSYSVKAHYNNFGSHTVSIATGKPTVTTNAISNITATGATTGGNVTASGGATVTARGVCYATTQNPTTDNTTVPSGSGTGSFTSDLTNLQPGTTYYVRAYATNSFGTNYGNEMTFETYFFSYNGLIAYYPFNGNAMDESGNQNHCNVIGASLTSDRYGILDKAYIFDGIDDYLNCGNFIDFDKTLNISGWFKLDAEYPANHWRALFLKDSYYPAFGLMYNVPSKLLRLYNNENYNGIKDFAIELPIDEWFHISLDYDGVRIAIFYNGAFLGSRAYSNTITDRGNLLFGINNYNSYHWKGKIDDILIYNRSLSDQEISFLYQWKK